MMEALKAIALFFHFLLCRRAVANEYLYSSLNSSGFFHMLGRCGEKSSREFLAYALSVSLVTWNNKCASCFLGCAFTPHPLLYPLVINGHFQTGVRRLDDVEVLTHTHTLEYDTWKYNERTLEYDIKL